MKPSDSPLTFADIQRVIDEMRVVGPQVVAIEMSDDMAERLRSSQAPDAPDGLARSALARVYGLPVRRVEGTGIARPVYE